ncbi:PREDICTED: uncharacterized protein C297.06c-like [Amphimedon queenslandica]|nr:PREDICTED: uncharacterized protein C297.06c-like [Amphimedon queenslandica]|eukprot:XP_019852629.1 PREDICTED: uncharacterized protein C297.06c-like [Amphimedon queenslandica]
MWLSEERSIFFSDLDSAQSRKLFRKFVRRWNSGKLKKKYYSGIQSSSLRHSSQTDYKWKVSSEDKDKLTSVCDQVSSWTSASSFKHEQEPSSSVIGPRVIGPVMKPAKRDPYKEEEEFERQREHLKKERKEYRKYNEMVMDEILPKATGFAAKIEKKRARVEARREREISPDFNESTLMGGATSDIKAKLMTEQKQREHRAQAASQKIIDYQAKEKARVAAILEQARANKKEGSLW